jgi:hypothetical protein
VHLEPDALMPAGLGLAGEPALVTFTGHHFLFPRRDERLSTAPFERRAVFGRGLAPVWAAGMDEILVRR